MTLDLALLLKAKRALDAQPMPDAAQLALHEFEKIDRAIDRDIIEELAMYGAIDGWRQRFNDPRNNPFA